MLLEGAASQTILMMANYCRASDVGEGSWQPRVAEDSAPAPCCSNARGSLWPCTKILDLSQDARLERDVRAGTNHSSWSLFDTGCEGDCARYRELGIGANLTWRPSRCRLHAWDALSFCAKLNSRRLLFVGDSTVLQMFALLVNEVQWGVRKANWSAAQMRECTSRLLFGPADTPDAPERSYGGLRRGRPWNYWVFRANLTAGDAVVLGFGAHVFGQSNFMHLLSKVASSRRDLAHSSARGVRFVWKSQTAAGCNDARQGARATPPDRAFWESHPILMPPAKALTCHDSAHRFDPRYRKAMGPNSTETVCYASKHARVGAQHSSVFNWPEFESRDTLAEAFWSSPSHHIEGLPAPALLNLRASHLRPDAHAASAAPTGADPECSRGFCRDKGESCRCAKDCLHACVPGPIDRLAPQLLHHMLAVGEI